ncbi:hypothetical protein IAD21_03265 [Abditibacteriota bacterium]|nr:hypothetical protein IAD21_03265 [Abditibacteriota bacterium]
MPIFAKILIGSGLLLVVAGLVFTVGARLFAGGVPGDIAFKRGNTSVYFPIVSSLLLSIVATVVLNIVLRFLR